MTARATSCRSWRSASAATIARLLRGTPSWSRARTSGASSASLASSSSRLEGTRDREGRVAMAALLLGPLDRLARPAVPVSTRQPPCQGQSRRHAGTMRERRGRGAQDPGTSSQAGAASLSRSSLRLYSRCGATRRDREAAP
jgi:hypothetical protein